MNTFKEGKTGNSLAVQWLGLGTFTAEGPGSTPGRGIKIPQAGQQGQKKKKKKKEKHSLKRIASF